MHLSSHFIVQNYDHVSSTMDLAREYSHASSCDREKIGVICAKTQEAGRGRLGRHWVSKEGNIYVSLVVFPKTPLKMAHELSFTSALAIGKTLDDFDIHTYAYKWPNDVFVNKAKISGVLLEADPIDTQTYAVTVGIGLNINSSPEQAMYPTTYMNEVSGKNYVRETVLERLCENFKEVYDQWQTDGFEKIRESLMKNALILPGEPMCVSLGDGYIEGHLLDVGPDGALWIQTTSGEALEIKAGDVWFR